MLFGTGALVPLPNPLYHCALRLRDRERALVRGWKKAPFLESAAYVVASDGTVGESFLAVQYCNGVLCTEERVVLTYYDEAIARGDAHAAEGVAIFDWEGTFLWGWNTAPDLPDIDDCHASTRLGDNLIGVFAYSHFPLVVLDAGDCRPVEIHHPIPAPLHGAQSIARRDDVWWFLTPYIAKDAAFAWQPGSKKPTMIGTIPRRHRYRGLADGRFINIVDGRAEILSFTPHLPTRFEDERGGRRGYAEDEKQ